MAAFAKSWRRIINEEQFRAIQSLLVTIGILLGLGFSPPLDHVSPCGPTITPQLGVVISPRLQ